VARTVCATVVSGDTFQFYIPIFIYAAKTAYPEWDVLVLVKGTIRPSCWDILRSPHFAHITGWKIVENQFSALPDKHGACGAARLLIPKELLTPYRFAYICDGDFLIFRHQTTHEEYHGRIMRRARVPYSTFRGPYRKPRRSEIHGSVGWKGNYTRLACGTLMIKPSEWYAATYNMRKIYKNASGKSKTDGVDKHRFASYREYDEVMLYRMVSMSGLHYPEQKLRMPDGSPFNLKYRDIHIGDYRSYSKAKKRIRKLVSVVNVRAIRNLYSTDEHWCHVEQMCRRNTSLVRLPLQNMARYLKCKHCIGLSGADTAQDISESA